MQYKVTVPEWKLICFERKYFRLQRASHVRDVQRTDPNLHNGREQDVFVSKAIILLLERITVPKAWVVSNV